MEKVLAGTFTEASKAITGALHPNKKVQDMKKDTVEESEKKNFLTSDYGVKGPTHDNWLSASTGDRTGPQLLEDSFGREKVSRGLLI